MMDYLRTYSLREDCKFTTSGSTGIVINFLRYRYRQRVFVATDLLYRKAGGARPGTIKAGLYRIASLIDKLYEAVVAPLWREVDLNEAR